MSFGGGVGVEADGHMGGLLLVEEVDEGVGEAELGVRIPTLAGDAGAADQGVVGAEDEGEGVEQEEFLLHGSGQKCREMRLGSMSRQVGQSWWRSGPQSSYTWGMDFDCRTPEKRRLASGSS